MKELQRKLKKCRLFDGLEEEEVLNVIKSIRYRVAKYKKDNIVAQEGDDCTSVSIVLEGSVEVQKVYPSGKTVILTRFGEGSIFGEAVVFSKSGKYPSTIIAASDTEILSMGKADMVTLFGKYPKVLERFIETLSDRILMLNKKVKELSFETMRQKICSFMMEEYGKQKSLRIKVPFSRKTMAEFLGVQRPSLSRELINMKKGGLIEFDKDIIEIKDLGLLEEFLI